MTRLVVFGIHMLKIILSPKTSTLVSVWCVCLVGLGESNLTEFGLPCTIPPLEMRFLALLNTSCVMLSMADDVICIQLGLRLVVIYLHMYKSIMYDLRRPRIVIWLSGMALYFLLLAEAFQGMSFPGANVLLGY